MKSVKAASVFAAVCAVTVIMASLSLTAYAKTPRYDENGNIIGYDYSAEDFDQDKLNELVQAGSENGGILAEYGITVNGELITLNNIDDNIYPIYDENGNDCLPIRPFAEAAGYTVEWDGANLSAILLKDNIKTILKIGENIVSKNNENTELISEIRLSNDRTYVAYRDLEKILQ